MFLEMAAGDVDAAVGLYFATTHDEGSAVPMDAAAAPDAAPAALASDGTVVAPAWWSIVWPAQETPPEAWREQQLVGGGGWAGGIPQPKNGPCGLLAAVHGLILAEQHAREVSEVRVTAEAAAEVILGILWRCRPEERAPVRLVRPRQRGDYRPQAELEETEHTEPAALAQELRLRAGDFCGPGGVIDLLYSAVLTRGPELLRREALAAGGELPLVTQAFSCWLCTTELLSLMLRGSAAGNVGAFCGDGRRNGSWDGARVGLLSTSEQQTGVPVADALKSPSCPVWILHGGDHFTVAWATAMPPDSAGAQFVLSHWNGLPPGGPRLAQLTVLAPHGAKAGPQEVPKFYKPRPGEVAEVVQAEPEDKRARPGQYRSWRYEVLLAWDDPGLQGEARPPDLAPEPTFEQADPRFQRPGAWRCGLCYAKRFQTMDFGLVPADSPDACPKCRKPRRECGWSIWMAFEDLPAKFQASVMQRHAKKLEAVLWTKWPAAVLSVAHGELPDC